MDLNRIPIFLKVAEVGSFTGAARALGHPKTTVSRKVSELESELGTRLLHRTTRSVRLTDAGSRYARECRVGLAAIEAANEGLAAARSEPRGTIRISAPADFSSPFMVETVGEFLARHRQTSVEVLLTDESLNLVDSGIDVAIRSGELADSSLVARRLGTARHIFCASPAYLKEAGVPRRPADLKKHRCIVLGGSLEGTVWRLEGSGPRQTVPVSGRIAVNTMQFALHAAVAGLGIARIPAAVASRHLAEGRLVAVLERYTATRRGLYVVYPSSRHLAPATSAFIELIVKRFRGLLRAADSGAEAHN